MIRAEGLSKCYTIYDRSIDRLFDWLTPGARRRGRPFWALRDISLEVKPGTSLGVVGVNGAGKSTLLKLLTGTSVPTSGTFSVDGRVSALLELGMGFHSEFTGRENIGFNGKLSGLADEELRAKTQGIIEFAELQNFIDQPLRTYSSGMIMRLAFAIASSVEPDVLIIDEALSVGDLHFQQRCLARIRRFHEAGVTVLFVSHDPALVKSFCNEAILLDGGCLIDRGRPDDVLDHYNALLAEKYRDDGSKAVILRPRERPEFEAAGNGADAESEAGGSGSVAFGHRTGNFQGAITAVEIKSSGVAGNSSILLPGTPATISIRAVAFERISEPTVGIMIKDRLGNEIYGVNTWLREHAIPALDAGEALEVDFSAQLNVGPGLYSITAALHSGPTHTEVCFDWIERAATFQILPTPTDRFTGVCRLETKVEHRIGKARESELESLNELKSKTA